MVLRIEGRARALPGGNEEAVAAQLSRQEVLAREDPEPPCPSVLLVKGVLLNPVGDEETMRARIDRLIGVSCTERISAQIIPDMVPDGGNSGVFRHHDQE
ncbi:Scr1 family TA system antitoxin-like transcriptional regulator [Thermomonospora catenispora]|uniref:Scr1 family TA system antitoxin-like transcriptional regulator n=1 Tax=Thermomonospora catenispora TaxID=2493090 RepID=UPI00137586F4|nr:Scr1 family TA system antitoxin-like transcriptional regulator [Thermomonospora catenispora]